MLTKKKKINTRLNMIFVSKLVKDVVKVVKLFNILADKIEIDESYIPSMCSLLKVFQYPFFKEKSSDEIVYEQAVAECMADLGYLFRIPYKQILSEICSCLYNLLTFADVPASYADLQRCSRGFIGKAVRLCDLSSTLVKSLTLMEENVEMRLKIMKLLQILSEDEKNCDQMLGAECASRIILKMNNPQANEE